jgi:hypothetical protein
MTPEKTTTFSELINYLDHSRLYQIHLNKSRDRLMMILVFNATFSNISAISWQPVLVVEEAKIDLCMFIFDFSLIYEWVTNY